MFNIICWLFEHKWITLSNGITFKILQCERCKKSISIHKGD